MKLIILGNGFDLHHKHKTSFYDFRNYLKNSKRQAHQRLIMKIDELLDVDKEKRNELLWNDFEAIIGAIMENDDYKNHRVKNIPNLIEEFTESFYEYLLNIAEMKDSQLNKNLADEFENASAILTFNYTAFYSPYINNNTDIFHIHGSLENNNLPIIGYYYHNIKINSGSSDYTLRYKGKLIHKPALAYKQNDIDLARNIENFKEKWRNKISELIIIGYSFGSSDNHIYSILDTLLVIQTNNNYVPASQADKIPEIKIVIYNYNEDESNQIAKKIKSFLLNNHRKTSINITGNGITPKQKEILTFELKNY